MERFYPVFLDMKKKKCLVVGGGMVAARKVKSLLDCGAAVTVVSPALTAELKEMAAAETIAYLPEPYNRKHLAGAFLVIVATDEQDTNRMIAADCFARNVLVNVVDIPDLCNFYVPSLVSRGPLSVAISTEGKSPAYARLLREELEQRFSEDHGEFVRFLGEIRPLIMEQVTDSQKRKELFREIAGEDFFNLYKTLPFGQLEEKAREMISRYCNLIDN